MLRSKGRGSSHRVHIRSHAECTEQSMAYNNKRGPETQMTIVPDDLLIGTSTSGNARRARQLIWILRQTKEWFYFGASFVSPIRTGVGNNTDCHWLLDFANFDEGWSFAPSPILPTPSTPPNSARHLAAHNGPNLYLHIERIGFMRPTSLVFLRSWFVYWAS